MRSTRVLTLTALVLGASLARSTWSTRTPFHTEGETQNQSKVVKFQMRPNPLAK